MPRLLSVNVGLPRDIAWRGRTVHTAIWKQPVAGRRTVRRLNIDGDGQGDLAGHGGEHRAVYAYQIESYRHWENELGRHDFSYGQFGENFTVTGLPDDEVAIGDRYRIGTALLEVTQPRVTCYRVGIRMDEPRTAALLTGSGKPTGRSLYIARPIQIRDPACLVCHGTVEAAPKTLVERYGPANGFGWQMNEVIGAQVVSVPTEVPTRRALAAYRTFMASLAGVFIFIGIALNLMLYAMVIRPVTRLSRLADQVSLGNMDVPDFQARGRDEIGVLAGSFNRMKKSVVQAMKMLEE